ncbi:MAG: TIGR03620 family F420-dependent LLM class oxidoreductase [Pseudomonadota bacterium]
MDKSNIKRLGLWSWLDSYTYRECIALAQRLESLGYGALWIPEAVGRDPFVTLSVIAPETDQLLLATGIANLYARDAMAMKAARNALDELSGGRLLLGIGVSHAEMVDGLRQHEYSKPLTTMRHYLERLEQAMYLGPPPEKQGMLLLAALREKMLGLAGSAADGAHPYFVTPEHTARAREIMGPDKFLAPEQKVLLEKDPSTAREAARKHMSVYLGLPNYRNNLLTLGFTESDFDGGGSDRLVDAIVAWGDETELMKRVEAHWANGADHVCIQALRPDGENGFDQTTVDALAPG